MADTDFATFVDPPSEQYARLKIRVTELEAALRTILASRGVHGPKAGTVLDLIEATARDALKGKELNDG